MEIGSRHGPVTHGDAHAVSPRHRAYEVSDAAANAAEERKTRPSQSRARDATLRHERHHVSLVNSDGRSSGKNVGDAPTDGWPLRVKKAASARPLTAQRIQWLTLRARDRDLRHGRHPGSSSVGGAASDRSNTSLKPRA